MQLKKMREILPTFYASQINEEHHSLTTSPKQESVAKANPATTKDKNQNCSYQKTEQIKSNQITCIKCRCVQETSALELRKQTRQQGGNNFYVCNKCILSVPSINFVTDPTSVFDTKNKRKQSPSKILKPFIVKNIQPDKYYCDKCRFSTKDPLQYKKHITQHEEIKFVCSYCGCISYTKGEFQRHLVRHTGKFPYQCQYCDYGAIRNDYIVKHIKRLHNTIVDNLVKVPVEKAEQNTSCWLEQNSVTKSGSSPAKQSVEAPLQNKSSNESFNASQDETPESVCMSSSAECSQGIAFIQEKSRVEPSALGNHENENVVVEVEVYSPQKEPIMPEMPLTVVAPATLVVPPNCLAEIVEVKSMNGVQRLILKLLPVKEMTSWPENCQAAEPGNQCTDQGEKTVSGSLSPTLDDYCVLDNECHNDFGSVVFPSSAALNCNSVNSHKNNVMCKGNEEREKNLTETLAELSPDQKNSGELTSSWKYGKHRYLRFDFSSFKCLTPLTSKGGNVPQNSLLDTVKENNSVSPSSGFDTNHFMLSNAERGHCNKLPVTNTHSFDSSHSLESHAELQQSKSLCLNGPKNVTATGNEHQKENISVDSFEVQNVKTEDQSSEGPVISSVFSLSSGAANIPEGIQWDDTLPKKSSTSMLCRKIAQLMAAAESSMKSQLATSLRCDKGPPEEKKLLYPEAPEKLERSGSTTELEPDPVSSPKGPSDARSHKDEHSNRGEWGPPLETPKRASSKKRIVNRTHASPVFIPPGTVLRVFDCIRTKDLTDQGNGNETLSSPVLVCSDTFLPRPVSCCTSENCIQTPSSLPTENGVMSYQRVSHWCRKKRKGNKRKHIRKNKHSRSLPYPKGSEINTQSKGKMKGKKTKKKGKQANAGKNLTKKTPSNKDDCYIIKVEPVLTRRLQLIPFKRDQLIKCPHHNQPVIVLNHPDVDSPEITNVMKVINKYKLNVVKAVLSERTISCLHAKRHHKRLTFQDFDRVTQMQKLNALKMKLRKIHRNAYKVVGSSPAEATEQTFQCWFCGRTYVDQEEWISHGQKHLMEATSGWDVPSGPLESDEEEICVD